MRQELFKRGVITPEQFEEEVRAKAILTQRKERLVDPYTEEEKAVAYVRRYES